MKNVKNYFLIIFLIVLTSCNSDVNEWMSTLNQDYIFPDPIMSNLADPFVLTASDGYFYLYGTMTNQNGVFGAWKSSDLINWTPKGIIFQYEEGDWSYTNFWAPEVLERDGQFYLFFTARERGTERLHIGLAISDSPTGPFIDKIGAPLLGLEWANIDGSPFIDDDGRIFLYFSRDSSENVVSGMHRSDIYVIEIDQEFNPMGEPKLLFTPMQQWEMRNLQEAWRWVEAPTVIKVGDIYYMTYSANPYWSFYYGIGIATSNSPLGPWIRYEANPVLRGNREQGISGPGHNSIFKSHDGLQTFIAYHIHANIHFGGGNRRVLISEVEFVNGTMRLICN